MSSYVVAQIEEDTQHEFDYLFKPSHFLSLCVPTF